MYLPQQFFPSSMFFSDEHHPGASDCLFSPIRLFNPSLSSLIKLNLAWTAPDRTQLQLHVPTPLPITSKAFDLIRRFTGYCWISQRPRSITVFCPCCCFQRYCVSAGVCEEVRLKDESLLTVGGNLTLSRLLHQMMNAESLHEKKEKPWVLAALLSQHHSGESIWAFFGKALTFRPLLELLSDYF